MLKYWEYFTEPKGQTQGSHKQALKNFNDFSMIFQDKIPEFPWWSWTSQNGKTQDHMLRMASFYTLCPLLCAFKKIGKSLPTWFDD